MSLAIALPRRLTRAPNEVSIARSLVIRAALVLGAISVLGIGADHAQQYYVDNYSTVPTIGTLFALDFVACALVGTGLLLPLGWLGRRAAPVRSLLAIGGIGLGAGSLAGLLISEHGGLFGFVEHGYRLAIVLSIVSEVAAVLCLSFALAASVRWAGGGSAARTRSAGNRASAGLT